MIFLKRSHYDSRRSGENRPSGDRDGAPRNALYARKQVFVQASHAEQSWQVPFTPKDSFAAAARESARAWQTLWQQAKHYRDRRFDVSKTFADSQLSLAGFGFAF